MFYDVGGVVLDGVGSILFDWSQSVLCWVVTLFSTQSILIGVLGELFMMVITLCITFLWIVSLKVSLFAWRLFWNGLLTKDNHVGRGKISLELQCVIECVLLKFSQRLFSEYNFFGDVWNLVLAWLNAVLKCQIVYSNMNNLLPGYGSLERCT